MTSAGFCAWLDRKENGLDPSAIGRRTALRQCHYYRWPAMTYGANANCRYYAPGRTVSVLPRWRSLLLAVFCGVSG